MLAAAMLFARDAAAGEPEVLLLAVRVDSELLSDAILAVAVAGEVRLPVAELAQLLELDATIDTRGKRILLGPNRIVAFDAARMTMFEDDILAGGALLAEWFSLRVTIDRNASTATLHAAGPLPYQVRRAREHEAARTLAGRGASSLPLTPNPYAFFDGPFVDTRIRMTGGAASVSCDYDVFATGDLAGLAATAFVSGSAVLPLGNLWLTLGRRDPEPVLLGPLRAREFSAGEVFLPGDDLVALPTRGTGAAISSFPLDRSAQFDAQTLTGELHPDEDVELYVNGALSGYARGGEGGGHYTFPNVPVLYGLNVFRLVFHDVRGRQRVVTRTFNAGDTLTRKGRLDYRVITAGRHLVEVAYGLTRQVTVTATATSLALADGQRHDYFGGGVRATFGRVFGYGDLARDLRGGTAARVGMQTRIGPVALSASRTQLDGFVSEIYRSELGAITARTSLRAGGAFGRRFVIPLRVDLAIDELESGGRITRLGGTASAGFRRLLVTNTLQATLFRAVPGATNAASGTLRFSRFSGKFALRGEAGYEIRPRRELTTVSIAAELRHFRRIDLGAAIDHNLATRISRALASVRHDAGRYAVALSVEVPSRGAPVARVELSMNVLHNPLARRWSFGSRPSAAGGAVAAFVFLDRNANGAHDKGEPPIPGAGFYVNRGSSPVVTDAAGVAFLDRLPADRRNEILISTATLEDPGWASGKPGTAFVARAGKPLVVHFPVVVTGEITGTVSRGGRTAASTRVQLLHSDGTAVAETFTAYDGFYVFSGVKPGTYRIRVAGDAAPRTLTVSAEEHSFDNIDFSVAEKMP